MDELKLLKGSSIYVDNIPVYPLTIGEITDLGYINYNKYLNIVAIDKERVAVDDDKITNFEIVCSLYLQNIDISDGEESTPFRDLYCEAMRVFLHEQIEFVIDGQYAFIIVGDVNNRLVITGANYDRIIEVIKIQNCLIKSNGEDDSSNPADEKTRLLLEKRKKVRQLLDKAKKRESDDSEPLTLADLVSILCANGNGVTPFNVWDLNFYMFNNQFNRMQMLEQYDINIRSLMAGAKPEEIDLKHWMSPIK